MISQSGIGRTLDRISSGKQFLLIKRLIKGIDQAIRILDATPLAPQIAELSSEKQEAMVGNLQNRLERFLNGEVCRGNQVSNIMIIQL